MLISSPVTRLIPLAIFFLGFLSNCGGGGSSADNVNSLSTTFSLSGTIQSSDTTTIDSDVNDPFAPFASNDTPDISQIIPNPVILGGYVNAPGTGPDGRSQDIGDPRDLFQVTMTAGQTISLFIADAFNADLELMLFDESGQNLIDISMGSGGTRSITVPAAGTYQIGVQAVQSASNYTLIIGRTVDSAAGASAGPTAEIDSPFQMRLSDAFVVNEAIVRFLDASPTSAAVGPLYARAAAMGLALKAGAAGRALLCDLGSAVNQQQMLQSMGTPSVKLSRWPYQAVDSRLQAKLDTLRVIQALGAHAALMYAEPNYIRQPLITPDDALYPSQWHYPLINLPQAWDITQGDRNPKVIVAVVDTGVLLNHPDLQGQLVTGYDFIRDPDVALDGDGLDADPQDPGDQGIGGSSFHGTHVAGTVAAASNNQIGVAGVAWQAKIMPLRALGKGGGNTFDIQQAVLYAAGLDNDSNSTPTQKADIINLSVGGQGFSQSEQEVYTRARNAGVIIVAAAGNEFSDTPFYPASYDGVISVSAVDISADQTPYSNFGPFIDVAAPGGNLSQNINGDRFADGVLSTAGDDSTQTIQLVYKILQGTSMATPHVAGVAALMKSMFAALSPEVMDNLLASGSITEDLGTAGRDDNFGHGLINALKAVNAARELAGGDVTFPASLTINPSSLDFGMGQSRLSLSVRNSGTEALQVIDVSVDADWLSVTPGDDLDPATQLGNYAILVNRADLADGTYTATLTFTSTVNTVAVPIIMQVARLSIAGDAGYHYILLLDADTQAVVDQLDMKPMDGRYDFTLTNVSPGAYQLLVGTDSNNNGLICDAGEACGAYITLDQPNTIQVDQDIFGLDFGTGFNFNLPASVVGESFPDRVIGRQIQTKDFVR